MTPASRQHIPDGFVPAPARGPFSGANGPFWRQEGERGAHPRFGFMPEERHCNGLGFVHGGMIATALDHAMAQCLFERHGGRLVTLSLTIAFERPVPKGRWITLETADAAEAEGEVRFAATLYSRTLACARATGTYRLLGRPA